MSIDKKLRNATAQAIEAYLQGMIDNYALDDVLSQRTTDIVCQEVAKQMWYFYDDISRHRNEGRLEIDLKMEEAIRRWIEVLRSNTEWHWRRREQPTGCLRKLMSLFRGETPEYRQNEFWPFESASDFDQWRAEENRPFA